MDIKPTSKRISKIIIRLKKAYPESRVSLSYRNPFQLLIATILSAQCTDKRANSVASYLFKKYKCVKGFSQANIAVLRREIYSTGFYNHKAKNIVAVSISILKNYHGRVPDTMEDLVNLPGVGRKTANIILSSAFHKPCGIAVDTHVKRLSQRLHLSKQKEPGKIEQDLLRVVPKRYWLDFNYILVTHGRRICKAQNPLCWRCIIKHLCPTRDLKQGDRSHRRVTRQRDLSPKV